jgi:hypothetical protein
MCHFANYLAGLFPLSPPECRQQACPCPRARRPGTHVFIRYERIQASTLLDLFPPVALF